MKWNWEQDDWPNFSYDPTELTSLEDKLLYSSGELFGVFKHLDDDEQTQVCVELICDEAITTSAIEGEFLSRDSIQSSIRKHFGLQSDHRRVEPAEFGISEMMVDLYESHQKPLSNTMLYKWHTMLCNGRQDLEDIGNYRTGEEPMQVISGMHNRPKIHFEAPPSSQIHKEMKRFIEWFNKTASKGKTPLPALTRSGIAHLYFVSIHPFEDGNGRIGRAIAEKAFTDSLEQPALLALSSVIEKKRKDYYSALEAANRQNEITHWLVYFAQTLLKAQKDAKDRIEFIINKSKLLTRLSKELNQRQEKVLLRMFEEGPSGFKGGLSAENYISITKTSRQTATRDLQQLVKLGALNKSGARRGTRYTLNI